MFIITSLWWHSWGNLYWPLLVYQHQHLTEFKHNNFAVCKYHSDKRKRAETCIRRYFCDHFVACLEQNRNKVFSQTVNTGRVTDKEGRGQTKHVGHFIHTQLCLFIWTDVGQYQYWIDLNLDWIGGLKLNKSYENHNLNRSKDCCNVDNYIGSWVCWISECMF